MSPAIGHISYINVAPVYYALDTGIIDHDFTMVHDTPANLNDMMRDGALLLSSCSCLEYARRFRNYFLVRDLSIASHGPVMSVLILSDRPLEEMDGEEMLLTRQSHTSVILTRLLLQERYHVEMRLETGNVEETLTRSHPSAVLTIGDEALRLRAQKSYPYVTDLATAWKDWTGLPFVFAVWVMSRKVCAEMHLTTDPTELLRRSRDYGMQHLDDVITGVEGRTPLTREELFFYYENALDYALGDEELQGLTLFYDRITRAGLIDTCPTIDFY